MRILAGTLKGRKLLPPPPRSRTRPITGLAKKSLFGMLGGKIAGAAVVDLYCGTGTLGLEALSRGARACWFAERSRAVLARLRRNIEALGVRDRCAVWAGKVEAGLARRLDELDGPAEVVFVDPPYVQARGWSWPGAGITIFAPLVRHLATGGVVVLRLPGDVAPPEALGGLSVERLKRYGDMSVALMGPTEG
jgi:16S rRNA (guanine966-N2)-methyltransferase